MEPKAYVKGIVVTYKTSTVSQKCFYCKQLITKGDKRVKMTDGAFFNHPTHSYYHATCFSLGITELLK
jgi:hypothetical protein